MTDTTKKRTVSAMNKYTGEWIRLNCGPMAEMTDATALEILELFATCFRDGKDGYFTLQGVVYSIQGFSGIHIDPPPDDAK